MIDTGGGGFSGSSSAGGNDQISSGTGSKTFNVYNLPPVTQLQNSIQSYLLPVVLVVGLVLIYKKVVK